MDGAEVKPPRKELLRQLHKMGRGDRIEMILAMRIAGKSCAQIAEEIGSSTMAVYQVIKRQRQRQRENGDPQAILDGKCKVLAVRNLERILIDKHDPHHWDATDKTLHGTGMLKRHVNTNVDASAAPPQLPALQVNVVNVTSKGLETGAVRELPDISVNAVGTPREI